MAPTLFDVPAKPGDLIEISRTFYSHWAVYIGNNEVVHLIPPDEDMLSLMDSSFADVRRQKLSEVAPSGGFQVNNLLDQTHAPRQQEVIVAEACKLVGRRLHYSVTTYNCEHFATTLRYGKAESRQASNVGDGAMVLGAVASVALGAVLFRALFSGGETQETKRDKRNRRGRRY